MHTFVQFAAEQSAPASGGLGALGLNLTSFLFQLITFVIVLLLLRKFVYGKLVATLEARREAVEKSLDNAKEATEELEKTQKKVAAMLVEARGEAEAIVATAHKESAAMLEEAEAKSRKRADHIVSEAKSRLDLDVAEARKQLRAETKALVAIATEAIIHEKLDGKKDEQLITAALKERV